MSYESTSLLIGAAFLIHIYLALSVSRGLLADITIPPTSAWKMIILAWIIPYIASIVILNGVLRSNEYKTSSSVYGSGGGTSIGGGDSSDGGGCGGGE